MLSSLVEFAELGILMIFMEKWLKFLLKAVFRIHIILIWIRIRIRIQGNFWFCESDFPHSPLIYYVNIKLLKIILKNFRHVKCKKYIYEPFWFIYSMVLVNFWRYPDPYQWFPDTDPDPKHCWKVYKIQPIRVAYMKPINLKFCAPFQIIYRNGRDSLI